MFHIINASSPTSDYNSILSLVNAGTGSTICSNSIPAGLPSTLWCKKIQVFHSSGSGFAFVSGAAMATSVNGIVPALQNGAQYVMLDELDNGGRGDSRQQIVQCCSAMAAYPQYVGRWGCFLSMKHYAAELNSSNPSFAAIDALLDAHAIIGAETYAHQSVYHSQSGGGSSQTAPAPNYPAGDTWLGNYWKGGPSIARFMWLVNRRNSRSSSSRLTAVFAVVDAYLDRQQRQNAFMNHCLWVWRHKTGYPSTINAANGGAGTYKWETIGDAGRDAVYQTAWNYYCRDFSTGAGAGAPYT